MKVESDISAYYLQVILANMSPAELAEYISGKLWIAILLMFIISAALMLLIAYFVIKRSKKKLKHPQN